MPAPWGKYAVLGNHDYWTDPEWLRRRLEAIGCRVLVNENVSLPHPFEAVSICGLDDHWTGRPDGAAALRGASPVRVVLMHAPSGLLDLGSARFDLALCGHTHGGQVALPGGRAIVGPYGELSRRYLRGRFDLECGTLIVSAGVGCSIIPLRTFAPPEVVVCELTAGG